MSRLIRLITFAALANMAIASHAFAHGHLKSAIPEGRQAIASPAALHLAFSESLNIKFSKVTVTGPQKQAVRLGTPALSDEGKTLTVPVPDTLPAGTYEVNWRVLSTDGHTTHGNYNFTVAP